MTSEEQRDQVAHFGDHLRRSMMESFEQVVKARLGKIKDEGLWDRYHREVVPLLRRGKLSSAPTEDAVYALGRRMRRTSTRVGRANAQSGGMTGTLEREASPTPARTRPTSSMQFASRSAQLSTIGVSGATASSPGSR